jgi:hypothetical protein
MILARIGSRRQSMSKKQTDVFIERIMEKIHGGTGSYQDKFAKIVELNPSNRHLKNVVSDLNISFDAIRLIFKYLMFDLEATQRERDKLRTMLEDGE